MKKPFHEIEGAHINTVTILGGDDNYNINSKVVVESDDKGQLRLEIPRVELNKEHSHYRLRGEPAIKIDLTSEYDEESFSILIAHHKGTVYFERL